MSLKLSAVAVLLILSLDLVSCGGAQATGGIGGTGTTGKIAKWAASTTLTDSGVSESNGNVGIGISAPGEKLHIGDGNLLIDSGGERAVIIKREDTFIGGPSGTSVRPIFQLGRIVQGGDLDPEFRFLYSDDKTPERSVLEFDRKGVVASVKPAPGSHFEGFILGDAEPLFRLNSFPKMRLEMGPGSKTPVDVAIQRETTATLTFLTGTAERVRIDANGRVGVGTASPAEALDVAGNVRAAAFLTASDGRLKFNVTQLLHVLDKLENIRGVSFDWNDAYPSPGRSSGHREIGLIAQELEAVFPELVTRSGKDGYRVVDYGRLTGVLVEAIKELRAEKEAEIKPLESQVVAQQQQITALREQNVALADRLTALESNILRAGSKN